MKRHGLRKQDTGYSIVLEIFKDYLLRMETVAEYFYWVCLFVQKKCSHLFHVYRDDLLCYSTMLWSTVILIALYAYWDHSACHFVIYSTKSHMFGQWIFWCLDIYVKVWAGVVETLCSGFCCWCFFFYIYIFFNFYFFTVTLAVYLMRWQKELKMTDCFACSGAVCTVFSYNTAQ